VAASQDIGQRLLPRRLGSTRHDACSHCSLQTRTSPTPVNRRRRSRSPRSASSLAHSPRRATAGPPFPSSSSPRASSQRQVTPSLACPIHPPNDAARDTIPIEPAASLVLHLPRLRALALLRRRPAARVESTPSRRPRNLHRNGPEHLQQLRNSGFLNYSISSSARSCSKGGIVRPSALAVFMLMISSNFVGCSTGRSEGLAPFKMLST
jgi:hypothetical protein